MLKLFRQNLFIFSVFLLLYVLILRMAPFIIPIPVEPEHEAFMSKILYHAGYNTWWLKVFGLLIVMVQGIQINRLVNLNRLLPSNSMFAGVMYVLLISLSDKLQFLYPQLIANTFLIAAIHSLFSLGRHNSVTALFNSGFFLGLASLFYFHYFFFLLPLIGGHFILKSLHRYDLVRTLSGFFVPFFLAFAFLFTTGALPAFSFEYLYAFSFFNFMIGPDWQSYLVVGIYIIFLLTSMIIYDSLTSTATMLVEKKITILFWILITALFILFISPVIYLHSVLVLGVPLAIFTGAQFLNIENETTAEGLHMILFVLALLLQYVL